MLDKSSMTWYSINTVNPICFVGIGKTIKRLTIKSQQEKAKNLKKFSTIRISEKKA